MMVRTASRKVTGRPGSGAVFWANTVNQLGDFFPGFAIESATAPQSAGVPCWAPLLLLALETDLPFFSARLLSLFFRDVAAVAMVSLIVACSAAAPANASRAELVPLAGFARRTKAWRTFPLEFVKIAKRNRPAKSRAICIQETNSMLMRRRHRSAPLGWRDRGRSRLRSRCAAGSPVGCARG